VKRIYCVRHAKSSWSDPFLDDIDRPLNKRGKKDSPFMAAKLKEMVENVEYAAVSPAKRARRTAEEFEKIYKLKGRDIVTKIYHASSDMLIDVLHDLPQQYDSAMIFGHNPGFTFLHNTFAARKIDNLPTCGIFEIVSDVEEWEDIDTTNSRVGFVIYPKLFS
jgi:phosphohistidine phosphatase